MAVAQTTHGALHYELFDLVAPWQRPAAPILFHHGIGSSRLLWRGWYPALADRYRVAAFDMRGSGQSFVPPPDADWSLESLIDDLFAVADAAGLDRFHLVGESMGGTVALAATLARPDRIASLTVSNGAHLGASIQRVEVWRGQLDAGGLAGWSRAFMLDRFHPDALSAEMATWFEHQQAQWSGESILKALGVLIGTDLTARLQEIVCPVLLLHPDGSPFIPVSVMAELHRLLPNARLNVIGPARHGLPFSHAAQSARLLRSFLDSSEPPNGR
ncbi:alpha/beta fold hydrolase [Enhydrobacter aerosaccus]|nr:alpha/beta hydrolase [Enhydrobacter aerosaccus]